MDDPMQRKLPAPLDMHRLITIATQRPGGGPQATRAGGRGKGPRPCCLGGHLCRQAWKLALGRRVPVMIDRGTQDLAIIGPSTAARAQRVADRVRR